MGDHKEDDGMVQARALLEQEKAGRMERCRQKIDTALREERCDLDVAVLVTIRGNIPQLKIVSQE